MAYFFSILYLITIILQPNEWIESLDGIPIQQIFLLLGIVAIATFQTKQFKAAVYSMPSKVFLAYIIVAIISCYEQGQAYGFGFIGYMYLKFYLGFILVVSVIDSEEKFNKYLNILLFCSLIVSYHCINLYHNGVEIGHGIGATAHVLNWRGSVQWLGTYAGTNTTALLLLLPLTISIGFLYKQGKIINKLYYLIATVIVGYTFLLTNSRGGFLGLIAILCYFFYIRTTIKLRYFIPLILLLGITAFVLKPQEEGRGLGESSTPERIELFHQGLEMFKANPVLGIGTEQFPRNNPIHKTAHNIYLNTLAENGFIGLFLFILMYYLPVRELFKINSNKINKINKEHEANNNNAHMKSDANKSLKQVHESTYLSTQLHHITFMAFVGFSVTVFFLTARHEIPILILSFVTVSAMNRKASLSFSFKEVKIISITITALVFLVYIAIQLFFKLYR